MHADTTALAPFVPGLRWETGRLGEFPYVRAGDGPRTLVVLPGFGDAMFSGRYPPVAAPALATYFRRYLDEHAVYLLSRPRGLGDYDVRESADDHARVLGELGPVDVLGISMGGLVGQQLAARSPELVDRLIVANSAYRLGDSGRGRTRRMLQYARERDWAAIRSELARGMFADWRQFAYPPLVRTVGRVALPRPAVPDDVVVSLRAILAYDGRSDLNAIHAPTLVVGGSCDPYFTEPVVRETAAGVPDAELSLLRGAKHGAFHERKLAFDRRTTAFLDDRPVP